MSFFRPIFTPPILSFRNEMLRPGARSMRRPALRAIHLLGVLGDGRAVGGLRDLAVLEAAAKLGEAGEAAGGARARDCRRARWQGSVSQQSHTHAFEVNSAHPRRRSGARIPRHSSAAANRWTWPSTCSTGARPCTNDPLVTESRRERLGAELEATLPLQAETLLFPEKPMHSGISSCRQASQLTHACCGQCVWAVRVGLRT